jgi:hypothetical protein
MVFNYAWGTQRPQIRKRQLDSARKVLVGADKKLDLDYQSEKARIAEELKKVDLQITQLDFLTPNGRYSTERHDVLRLLSEDADFLASLPRQRGRPKKA